MESTVGIAVEPATWSTEQAAAYLNVKLNTLEVWRSTRRYALPYVRIGGRVRYLKSDLDAWIASRRVARAAA